MERWSQYFDGVLPTELLGGSGGTRFQALRQTCLPPSYLPIHFSYIDAIQPTIKILLFKNFSHLPLSMCGL
jgi:hypothetical protein